jgi:hypothetical protein
MIRNESRFVNKDGLLEQTITETFEPSYYGQRVWVPLYQNCGDIILDTKVFVVDGSIEPKKEDTSTGSTTLPTSNTNKYCNSMIARIEFLVNGKKILDFSPSSITLSNTAMGKTIDVNKELLTVPFWDQNNFCI